MQSACHCCLLSTETCIASTDTWICQDVYSPYTGSYGVTPLAAGDYLNATGSYYSDVSGFLNSDTVSPTLRATRATNMQVRQPKHPRAQCENVPWPCIACLA